MIWFSLIEERQTTAPEETGSVTVAPASAQCKPAQTVKDDYGEDGDVDGDDQSPSRVRLAPSA